MNDEFNMNLKELSNEDKASAISSEISKIHFRCPTCSKLFSADAVNIRAEKPEFTCNSCETDFWISFAEALSLNEVVGYKITDSKVSEEVKPVSLKPENFDIELFNNNVHDESFLKEENQEKNKIEIEKEKESKRKQSFNLLSEESIKSDFIEEETSILDDLKNLIDEVNDSDMEFVENTDEKSELREPTPADFWSNVLGDYKDLSLHDEFINYCKEVDDIGYAAGKYKSMLDINKHDQIAIRYLNKIRHTAVMSVENEALAKKDEMERFSRLSAWSSGLIGVGALFVVMGFTFVQLKNLVGLGIALIFFTIAMQALLSKN